MTGSPLWADLIRKELMQGAGGENLKLLLRASVKKGRLLGRREVSWTFFCRKKGNSSTREGQAGTTS